MDVFKEYASFYDALYADKDYASECDFIESLWQTHAGLPVKSVLDLGCGSGGHAFILADRGYEVVGIDRSEEMLDLAGSKASARNLGVGFKQADIRNFDIGRSFDTAIGMFAVMSYLTANDDVINTLRCVEKHLKPGGLFIFDVWFGPAVLSQRPENRWKMVQINSKKILRLAEPTLDIMKQVVSVKYTIVQQAEAEEVGETHEMRFFFPKELELLVSAGGLLMEEIIPFLTPRTVPSIFSWNITCICKRPLI
jgi:SAM-dependent methyltransferase